MADKAESSKRKATSKAEESKTLNQGPKPLPAKSGKRSAKAIAEAESRVAKQELKKAAEVKTGKPLAENKQPRSRLERAGKKYREAAKHIEKDKSYNLAEAVDLAAKTATTKFDSTVEIHINLMVDPKLADQNVRGNVVLPHGTGKQLRVAVFAEGDEAAKAKKAGSDIASSDDLLAQLDKEQLDFDVLITTPAMMPRLGKYAKLLGPKGLMPNPKSGTITNDLNKAVSEAKAGRTEYRVDQAGIIHLAIGKASFGPQKLLDNAQAVVGSVRAAKPASVKGLYIKSIFVTTTMGPSVKVAA